MKIKNIENFEVYVGDLALTISTRNNVPFIEVASLENDRLRALYTYPDCKLWNTNMPKETLSYVTNKVKKSVQFLKRK